MDLERPRFAPCEEIFAIRRRRPEKVRFTGLWVAGSLAGLGRVTVAVVGSRAPSEAARRRAADLGRTLARAGACLLSGLALGIDGSAHAGSLEGGGPTVGVLGGGHRRFFPSRNRALAGDMIASGGAVMSPFEPDEPARPGQFLQRNGVVAALADAVVIVEAAERSGALNTAGWAADLGLDVYAYPGDVDRPKAAGCNALIRDGAILVRDPADILCGLKLALPAPGRDLEAPTPQGAGPEGQSSLEASLGRLLARGPADLDALVDQLRAPPGEVLALLVRLEIAGRVERRGGRAYAQRVSEPSCVRVSL